MSKFLCATHSHQWTGTAGAPDQHLSCVTFLISPLAKTIQSLHPDLSSSGLSCTCDPQQLWTHCFAQVSFMAKQQKIEEHDDTLSPQALQLLIFIQASSAFNDVSTEWRHFLTPPLCPLQSTCDVMQRPDTARILSPFYLQQYRSATRYLPNPQPIEKKYIIPLLCHTFLCRQAVMAAK